MQPASRTETGMEARSTNRAMTVPWPRTLEIGVVLVTTLATMLFRMPVGAQTAPPPADEWITSTVWYPTPFRADQVRSNAFNTFAGLQAEVAMGQLKIRCPTAAFPDQTNVQLHVSVDAAGHWPARDWRTQPMSRHEVVWEAVVPVFDLDLPLAYFVTAPQAPVPGVSPMRLLQPRALGLTQPTRLFWSFLEGFEEGLESWRVLAPEGAQLHTDSTARMGRAAMAVTLPEGKHSVTVGTTRLRPWHLWKFNCCGLRVWLRTREGAGRARFSLLTNAYTTNQAVAVFPGKSDSPTSGLVWTCRSRSTPSSHATPWTSSPSSLLAMVPRTSWWMICNCSARTARNSRIW